MDERLSLAIDASRRWYDEVFAMHGVGVRSDGRLWVAASQPPPWHSAVKTFHPDVTTAEVLAAMEEHPSGSIADSFGTLDLAPHGFELIIDASWVFHPGRGSTAGPSDWVVVDDPALLERWSSEHDYAGVLLPEVLANPAFRVLARLDRATPVAGAVLLDAGPAVGASNLWSKDGTVSAREALDVLAVAGTLRPGAPVVDYARGAELAVLLEAGYEQLGPQRVWLRS